MHQIPSCNNKLRARPTCSADLARLHCSNINYADRTTAASVRRRGVAGGGEGGKEEENDNNNDDTNTRRSPAAAAKDELLHLRALMWCDAVSIGGWEGNVGEGAVHHAFTSSRAD